MTSDERNYKIVDEQENTLVFQKIDNLDAWKLGSMIVEEASEKNLPVAIDIELNGYQVFRYGFPGTNGFNDVWLKRKINTVNMMHKSSLRVFYMPSVGQDDIYRDGHLDPAVYGNMGGGFPIRVKGIGVVGVLAVSGLTHTHDHDLAVDGLTKFLGVKVKRVPERK